MGDVLQSLCSSSRQSSLEWAGLSRYQIYSQQQVSYLDMLRKNREWNRSKYRARWWLPQFSSNRKYYYHRASLSHLNYQINTWFIRALSQTEGRNSLFPDCLMKAMYCLQFQIESVQGIYSSANICSQYNGTFFQKTCLDYTCCFVGSYREESRRLSYYWSSRLVYYTEVPCWMERPSDSATCRVISENSSLSIRLIYNYLILSMSSRGLTMAFLNMLNLFSGLG